jgi:hypothetical protein
VRRYSKNLSSVAVGLVLFVLVTTPSLGMSFGAKSMAAGVALTIIVSIFLSLVLYLRLIPIKVKNLLTVTLTINAILLYVIISGVRSYFINDSFNDVRFFQTFFFLLFFIFGALNWSLLVKNVASYQVDFAVKFVFYVLLIAGFVSLIEFSPFFSDFRKTMIFFSEPSHFIVIFSPFLLYMAVISQTRMKLFFLFLTILLALSVQNVTFLACVLLIVVSTLRLHQIVIGFIAAAGLLVLGFETIDASYYISRLDLSVNSNNLSSLVFMSGWERAYLNFVDSSGWGIGFQQLGFIGDQGVAMTKLEELNATGLNLLDGGSVGAKLISEFGVLAVIGLFGYLFYFAKFVKDLRVISLGRIVDVNNSKKVFALSCIVMYFVELFARGTGYFTSTALLFVVSIIWLSFCNPSKINTQ